MALHNHLTASLQQFILDKLPYDREDAEVVGKLNAKAVPDLLITWLNWSGRMIPPGPRQVLQSKEFLANPVHRQHRADIETLISDIRSGAELTKYLSRDVKYGYVTSRKVRPRRRADLDLMLNDWGIHHLHFSREVEPDGFVQRNDFLIFAVFHPGKAYLVDIMTHQDWAREHVIRVILDNWPDAGLVHELRGVLGSSPPIRDGDRAKLRKKGITSPIQIDGRVYIPFGGGIATSGVSIKASMQADRLLRWLEEFALQYEADPQSLIPDPMPAGRSWPETPEFAVELYPGKAGVVERKSGIFFVPTH